MMSILDDLADLFVDELTITSRPALTQWGVPSGAVTTSTWPCRITNRVSKVRSPDGTEVTSQQFATIKGIPAVTVNDVITLPSRFSPREPPPVAIAYPTDEDGPLFVRVFF